MMNIVNTIEFMVKDINKYLDDITLNAITVDGKTILKLEDMSNKNISPRLEKILRKLIKIEVEHIHNFDFSKLQSLENSKSFEHLPAKSKNPSCYRDLYSWGKGMRHTEKLRAEDESDWKKNIQHIEEEGFRRNRPIEITYYTWLDRYFVSNNGGSHHAALVVWQSVRDKLEYKREANITKLSIDKFSIKKLNSDYWSFILNFRYQTNINTLFNLFNSLVSKHTDMLEPSHYHGNYRLFFVPKSQLKMNKYAFEYWYRNSVKNKKIIALPEYLENPLQFHTGGILIQ
ncbi:hypothetical protein JFK57_22565 [Escherichia coli]|nr:hypothetical protein [Escherichia coli]